MKNLTLILAFVFFPAFLSAQSLSVVYQPVDMGIGLRYDNNLLYASVSHGSYKVADLLSIKNHEKVAIGFKILIDKVDYQTKTFITGGISAHRYSGIENVPCKALFPLSCELGCGAKIRWSTSGFTFDFLKGEDSVFFGLNF